MLSVLLLSLLTAPDAGAESHYLDASLDLDGQLLSWRFLDLNDDGRRELVLAVLAPSGERELRVHRLDAGGLEREASTVVPILPDVLAWGAADVREEPGRELLLLTRAGAWSYSLTLPGYRGNARRLVAEPLLYDMPDPRELPYWAYVLPAEGGDALLLPGRERLSVWGPPRSRDEGPENGDSEDGVAQADYALQTALATEQEEASTEELGPDGRSRGAGVSVTIDEPSPFLPAGNGAGSSLLEDAHSTTAPALLDLNGDGRLDLLLARDERLSFYLGVDAGTPAAPTRVEALPEALLGTDEREVEFNLADINGDGLIDVVAVVADAEDGFENRLHRVLVYRGRADRLLSDEPDQVLRFEAGGLEVNVADVDGDGRMDLTVQKLVLPSILGTVTGGVTGIEFTFSLLLFPGDPRGFARRPSFTAEETFNEETAIELAANRAWTHDCSGDGSADLVEVDLKGDIAIRRLVQSKSRLRGTTWTLDPTPWKHFEVEGSIDSLTVDDFNGDGLGDIVSASEDRLTVLLSVAEGTPR